MTYVTELGNLERLVVQWAKDRNLIDGSDPKSQTIKLGEEFGELCKNINKGKLIEAKDDIGDMFVVLTILARQLDTSLEECVGVAYNEIKDRKGFMINNVFVKEEDLKVL